MIIFYYTGHGGLNGTQKVCLYDDKDYPMETKIRNFKNEHFQNCYIFGIFDACRSASGISLDAQVRGENDSNLLQRPTYDQS